MPYQECAKCGARYYDRPDGTRPHSCERRKKARIGPRKERSDVPCEWVACKNMVSVLICPPTKQRSFPMYNLEAFHGAGLVRHAICQWHQDRVRDVFGKDYPRNGITAALRGMDEPWNRVDPSAAPLTRLVIFDLAGGRCDECQKVLDFQTKNWVIDHRVAIMDGGLTTFRNLRPLCPKCDETKTKSEQQRAGRGYRRPT